MVDYISQDVRELKHISLLRRIFLKKKTGILHIGFISGNHEALHFDQGRFVGELDEVEKILSLCVANHVTKLAWERKYVMATTGWVAPWIALTKVLRHVSFDAVAIEVYKKAFNNLPEMVLKNCPVHRMNFAHEEAYLILYYLSLDTDSFQPKLFFSQSLNNKELQERISAMLLVFLLGYLKPAPKELNNKQSKVSIATRILQRLRRA